MSVSISEVDLMVFWVVLAFLHKVALWLLTTIFLCKTFKKRLYAFWAAAPKGRCPVEHRGEFRDVRPFVCPEGAYFRRHMADFGH